MIFSVERRRFRKGGTVQQTRFYYLRYRIGDMPADKWVSLGVTDKQVAHARAQEFIREKEREIAGILEPKVVREAAKRPLREHIEEFLGDLETKARARKYVRICQKRLSDLAEECHWNYPGEVAPESFIRWRKEQGQRLAAKTLNEYLSTASTFMNWLRKLRRVKANPLEFVEPVDGRGHVRRERRALTEDELRSLVQNGGNRGIIYLTAARTGLRRGELAQTVWGDVFLDAAPPHILARASTTKNRKDEPILLVPELVEALRVYKPVNARPGDRVFSNGIPRVRRMRKDMAKGGVAYQDHLGRIADFHSLRHTCATFMQRNGVPVRFAMKQMRHSDIKLTSKVYLDEQQLPVYDALKNLPRLGAPEKYTQIRAQILGATRQNESQAVADDQALAALVVFGNEEVSRSVTQADATGQMVRAAGFEPATPSV